MDDLEKLKEEVRLLERKVELMQQWLILKEACEKHNNEKPPVYPYPVYPQQTYPQPTYPPIVPYAIGTVT